MFAHSVAALRSGRDCLRPHMLVKVQFVHGSTIIVRLTVTSVNHCVVPSSHRMILGANFA
jgi:hypothetical protein